jgi:hypothetical protein
MLTWHVPESVRWRQHPVLPRALHSVLRSVAKYVLKEAQQKALESRKLLYCL